MLQLQKQKSCLLLRVISEMNTLKPTLHTLPYIKIPLLVRTCVLMVQMSSDTFILYTCKCRVKHRGSISPLSLSEKELRRKLARSDTNNSLSASYSTGSFKIQHQTCCHSDIALNSYPLRTWFESRLRHELP
jgi:hypothetical protein